MHQDPVFTLLPNIPHTLSAHHKICPARRQTTHIPLRPSATLTVMVMFMVKHNIVNLVMFRVPFMYSL